MKKITSIILIIFAWYFLYNAPAYNRNATVVGPFNSESDCNEIKAFQDSRYKNRTSPCWYFDHGGR
jgi:hypothetical protein